MSSLIVSQMREGDEAILPYKFVVVFLLQHCKMDEKTKFNSIHHSKNDWVGS